MDGDERRPSFRGLDPEAARRWLLIGWFAVVLLGFVLEARLPGPPLAASLERLVRVLGLGP